MRVDYAFICDYAEASGKLNALGIGFDTIYAPKVPFKHRHFCLVVQLRTSVVEAGQKKIEVHIIDQDGNDIIPVMHGQVAISKTEGKPESIGRIVMEFGNIDLKSYGTHSIRLTVEGVEMVNVPFSVSEPPKI
ncbi:MAG: hypothetical protein U9N44_02945 [Chloroflexota bacterium]|nr:hypothetical protein [Chloroflexota bacterium]